MLPLFPSYLSFITGMSVDRLTHEVTAGARTRVLVHSLAFIAGFSVVFVSLGASFSAAGQFLLDYRDWIRIGGRRAHHRVRPVHRGRPAHRDLRPHPADPDPEQARRAARLLPGRPHLRDRLDALRGPILGSILTLASNDKTVGQGITLLLFYSAGLGLPFLLSSVALGSFLRFFKRYRPFIPTVERAAGILLVLVGILVATNYYVLLNSWAISLTPEWLLKRL